MKEYEEIYENIKEYPYYIDSGTGKNPRSPALYRLWDLEKYRNFPPYIIGSRTSKCSELFPYMGSDLLYSFWDLEKSSRYRFWNLKERSTERSESRIVVYNFLPFIKALELEIIPSCTPLHRLLAVPLWARCELARHETWSSIFGFATEYIPLTLVKRASKGDGWSFFNTLRLFPNLCRIDWIPWLFQILQKVTTLLRYGSGGNFQILDCRNEENVNKSRDASSIKA